MVRLDSKEIILNFAGGHAWTKLTRLHGCYRNGWMTTEEIHLPEKAAFYFAFLVGTFVSLRLFSEK